MAKAPKLYTRIARPVSSLGTYTSLWLAADHVMQVESTGYSERYQRFQFGDIQGFFVLGSSRRFYWSCVGWVATLIPAISVGRVLWEEETPAFSAVFLILGLTFLIWNYALGPACKVRLVTKVQTVPLGALVRRRKALKVLGRLQPLIEAAQSDLVKPVAAVSGATAAVPASEPAPASATGASVEVQAADRTPPALS